ncbi:MAG: ATP synthase subunit I [Deltaproteobacteria bacterium]|nr:ATP synthase subunit I [Deltaproteobacteria bacterium]
MTNWVILALFIAASWFFASRAFLLGITLGGLISIINFYWLYRDLKKVFRKLADGSKSSIMIKYYFRFIVTGIALFFIIAKTDASVVGLIVGLSLVVFNIILNSIINLITSKTIDREDV